MSRRKVLYAVVVILSLVVAGFGVWTQVDARRDPSPSAAKVTQRELVPAPLTVSLSTTSDRRLAAIGSTTFLAVNAAGATISEVRLYDGDALIGVQRFTPVSKNRVSVQFEWPAVRAGAHVLHAEATGAEPTEVGHSAPLRLRAEEGAVPAKTARLPGNGRTPDQLAAATGVGAADLTFRTDAGKKVPAPAASRPLAPGITAEAPIDRISSAPPKAAAVTGVGTVLKATLKDCRASVEPTDGKVSVYELTGGGVGFTLRGTASPGSPYLTDELTPGAHVFVAGRGSEPADSDPVAVEAPDSCLADAWSGKATLFDGELTLPKPEPRVWVYLGVDGKPFQRVPAEGSVSAAFGTADLANVLPTLDGSKIRMEVWSAGATPEAPATRIARSESTVADATALADLIGGAPDIRLLSPGSTTNPVEMTPSTTSVKFGWQTSSQIPDGVIWQVLGRPLSTADRNTAPPVLLATGYSVNGDGVAAQVGSARGGFFDVPAEVLLAGRPVSGPISNILQQVPTPSIKDLVKPGSSFGVTSLNAPAGGKIPTLDAGVVPIPIGDVYVRVLPVTDDSVIGDASNTIAVTLPPLDPTKASFTATKVTFDPGRGANYQLTGCVRVTGTPTVKQDASKIGEEYYQGSIYRSDSTYCQTDFDSDKGGGCSG